MKKIFIAVMAVLMPLSAAAQAQINTKKVKISDFTQKVTKVVLTGNMLFDAVFQDGVTALWRISPYEFCTLDEFQSLKGDEGYYFLIPTKGQFKRETEPGLMFLTLVKGGKGSSKGIDDMLEIVSLPIASAEDSSGREFAMMPVFLTVIQSYTLEAMERDYNAYLGLSTHAKNITDAQGKRIVIAESDLGNTIGPEFRKEQMNGQICVADDDSVERAITGHTPNMIVSYSVSPADPRNGSFCYKMLIDTETYGLYMFRKHKINAKNGAGFMDYDIRNIAMNLSKEAK